MCLNTASSALCRTATVTLFTNSYDVALRVVGYSVDMQQYRQQTLVYSMATNSQPGQKHIGLTASCSSIICNFIEYNYDDIDDCNVILAHQLWQHTAATQSF
jgi:hypothetical protein